MEKIEQYKTKHHKIYHLEKSIVQRIEGVGVSVFGIKSDNWQVLTKILLYALFILNAFACYGRPDFLTQLVCVLALYFLNTDNLDQSMFRLLPLAVLMSFIYDIVYLFFIQTLANEGAKADGGREHSIKNFALYLSYATFGLKVAVFFVIWKVSFNFLDDFLEVNEAARHLKLAKIKKDFATGDLENLINTAVPASKNNQL